MDKQTTAFFTGHRRIDRDIAKAGLEQLINAAIELGVTDFISGMAIGVDQYAAGICYRRQLPYHVVLPSGDQYKIWGESWQKNWKFLVKHAATVECLYPKYVDGCLHHRNDAMIERSQICLAVWDGRAGGGTVHALTKAKHHRLKILVFNPIDQSLITYD